MRAADAGFSAFYRDQFASVTRAAYLIVHDADAAQDVAQDAFAQLLLHWSRVAAYDRPGAWVRRVAIRRAVRLAQRERRLGDFARLTAPTDREVHTSDPELTRAIRALPPQQRAAIVLHYFEDLPLPDVADILGCAHATAKVHVFKARQRLAELLAPLSGGATDVG